MERHPDIPETQTHPIQLPNPNPLLGLTSTPGEELCPLFTFLVSNPLELTILTVYESSDMFRLQLELCTLKQKSSSSVYLFIKDMTWWAI